MNPSFALSITSEGQTCLSVAHAFVLTAEQTYALARMTGVIEPETRAGWIEFRDHDEEDPANRYDPAIRESHVAALEEAGLVERDDMAWHTTYRLTDLGRRVAARLSEGVA